MKTLRISDSAHEKLTQLLGDLTAQTKTLQTYTDAIESLLSNSVILPPELLAEVENFINKNKQRGYTTREEFIREAIRFQLDWLNDEYEYFEVPKETIEKMDAIIDYMAPETFGAPSNAKEYISEAIDNAIERIFEAYREGKQHGLDKQTIKELEQRLKEIEEYWENIRKRRKT
ncbi:MAG: ribbon-helix-helix domain-containing protein [Candidatus Bathyarchaeia archaeon]